MDVAAALAELEELSTQVTRAVVVDRDGAVAGTLGVAADRAGALAAIGAELLAGARVAGGGDDVTRVEVVLPTGGVFVAARGRADDRRHDRSRPDRRPRRLRPANRARPDRRGGRVMRRLVVLGGLALLGRRLLARRRGPAERVAIAKADGSTVVARPGHARARGARRRRRARAAAVSVDALGLRLVEVALLEGDFLLRSGRRSPFYLDKYRFETEPELLRALGERLAAEAARGRARGRPPRRPRARGGRARGFGLDGVRATLHHRPR